MVDTIREKGAKPGASPPVALRSSAIGEDSELSYAGQYVSILNVPRDRIVQTYKLVVASLYTPRAISYRLNKGMRDEDLAMSVACIEMVQSVASGVIYSRFGTHSTYPRTPSSSTQYGASGPMQWTES